MPVDGVVIHDCLNCIHSIFCGE
ncbi:hypothetical protein CMEL01_14794 [Colletotrichum melonis]|uniref:Uncharacterized protein n=1 Tax=Colletotrichum melonis TaxID=1209925 RepID=A0AAI9XVI6_9PEZI|nr:hypothetical protein CMEL01_14794 [Colletotrichum melonis]